MNTGYDDTSSHVKITPSPFEAELKVLQSIRRGKPLTQDQEQILDNFYGSYGDEALKQLNLYFRALSEETQAPKSSDPQAPTNLDDEYRKQYIDNMTQILSHLVAKSKVINIRKYYKSNQKLFNKINEHILGIFQSNYITNLPPDKMEYIQRVLYIWAKTPDAVFLIMDFQIFEAQMKRVGVPIDPKIKNSLFYTYMNYYMNQLETTSLYNIYNDNLPNHHVLGMHLDYWLRHLSSRLRFGTVDDIWQDDIVNVMLQMMDKNLYKHSKVVSFNKEVIAHNRKTILQNPIFSKKKISEAFSTMESIESQYADKEIDDPLLIEKYAEAYKAVYLHEFLSGSQLSEKAYPTNHAQFIIMQAQSFLTRLGDKSNAQTLISRATQELVAKTIKEQMKRTDVNCKEKAISYDEPFLDYTSVLGLATASDRKQIIYFSSADIKHKNYGGSHIDIISHEVDHMLTRTLLCCGHCINIGSYLEYKTRAIDLARSGVALNNYNDLHSEIRARIAGSIAELNALDRYPVGIPKEKLEEEKESIRNEITLDYYLAMENKLRYQDLEGVKEESTVKLFDEIMRDPKRRPHPYPVDDILRIEYHKDGTPKTYAEILQNQKDEWKTGIDEPQNGPKDPMDRLAFRIQIMIQRAIAYEQEIELVETLNTFLTGTSKDLQDPISSIFPDGKVPSVEDLGKMYDQSLKPGAYEKAELLYGLYNVQERAMLKRKKFAEEVISTSAKQFQASKNQEPTQPQTLTSSTSASKSDIQSITKSNEPIQE